MGFIRRLKLKNFQSHHNTEITFDKGLTVILGQTDQGKSAIIRALKWVLYNEPRGTDFITAGSNSCKVTLEMNDGTVITRARDKNRNRYILEKDGKKEIFEGFGNNVPLEIIKAHGIPKIQIDKDIKSAVNLAEQLEPPFLISETGSNRAKALGRLVGVHIIDTAQRFTNRDLVDAQQHFKMIKKDVEELKDELSNYDDIHQLKDKIDISNKMLKQLKQAHVRYTNLMKIKESIGIINNSISNTKEFLSKLKMLDELEQYVSKVEHYNFMFNQLIYINSKLCEVCNAMKNEEETLIKTKYLASVENMYKSCLDLYKNFIKIRNTRSQLLSSERDIQIFINQIRQTDNLAKTEKIFIKLNILKEKLEKLSMIKIELVSVNDQISIQNKEILKLSKLSGLDNQVMYIEKNILKLTNLITLKDSISIINSKIIKGENYLNDLSLQLTLMAKKYGLILKKLAKCPTCMNAIDENTVEKIMLELLES